MAEALFAQMTAVVNARGPELVALCGAVVQFDIALPSGTTRRWTANLKDAPGSLVAGACPAGTDADLTLAMAEDDFLAMHAGTLNPQLAFMSGKVQFTGNIMMAMKLGGVIAAMKAAMDEAAASAVPNLTDDDEQSVAMRFRALRATARQ